MAADRTAEFVARLARDGEALDTAAGHLADLLLAAAADDRTLGDRLREHPDVMSAVGEVRGRTEDMGKSLAMARAWIYEEER